MPMNFARTAWLLLILTAIFVAMGWLIGGQGGMLIAFAVALVMNVVTLWKSDKIVLRMHGARELDPRSGGQLYQIIGELARRAELPMPRVFTMQSSQPNAFATGRNADTAVVCVSTGLVELLEPNEVAGVLAHELAHIKNHDTLTMTVAASLGGAISMVAQYLQIGALFGGARRGRFGWLGFLLTALAAPLAALLVQAAISRSREYQADRLGGMIVGNPLWLADALRKIQTHVKSLPNASADAHPATAHLFIINPLAGRPMDNLFSTHPNTENRIAELEKLAVEIRGRPHAPRFPLDGAPWLPSSRLSISSGQVQS